MYSPQLGSFLSRDPRNANGIDLIDDRWFDAGKPIATNLYTYASNNPINRVDPLGLSDVESSRDACVAKAVCAEVDRIRQEDGECSRFACPPKYHCFEDVDGVLCVKCEGTCNILEPELCVPKKGIVLGKVRIVCKCVPFV